MPAKNCIKQIRPTALFDNFKHYDDNLTQVALRLENLAQAFIDRREKIISDKFPFNHAQMFILWGKPGRGKTHLVEALVNKVAKEAPRVLDRMYFSRSDFTLDNIAHPYGYEDKPIIIMDDFFSRINSVEGLNMYTDIPCFMKFIQMVYEERRFVLVTCNFPFREGILQQVKKVDEVGRVTSRMKELLANSGEVQLVGKDYREELAVENEGLLLF